VKRYGLAENKLVVATGKRDRGEVITDCSFNLHFSDD